jgi:hypothetical protein
MIDKDYAKAQFEIAKAHATYWQAVAITGAYKQRDISTRVDGVDVQWTDEQKLKDALDISLRHIHRMSELAEKLYEDPFSKSDH